MHLFYGTIYHEKCGCRHSLLPLSPLIHLFFLSHLLNSTLVLKPTFFITLILLSLFHLLDSSSGIRPGFGGSLSPFCFFTELVQCLGVSLPASGNDFCRHFKSPHSHYLSSSLSFLVFHLTVLMRN